MDSLRHVIELLIFVFIYSAIPIIFILMLGVLIFGPALLRWVMPCKSRAGKVAATAMIASITVAWLALRLDNPKQLNQTEFIVSLTAQFRFMPQDALLLGAWIVLVLSLLIWPGHTRLQSQRRPPTSSL
jgi:hypothetical protein